MRGVVRTGYFIPVCDGDGVGARPEILLGASPSSSPISCSGRRRSSYYHSTIIVLA